MLSWGIRMGLALVVPQLIGVATGYFRESVWVGLIAEGLCWVELKGSIAQRIQVVLGGILISLLAALTGTLTSASVLLSTGLMFGVGLVSGLFKNLGDRGSGLAICVYVSYIISNAIPVTDANALGMRLVLTAIGGGWYLLLALTFSATLRQHEPYRRSIGLIWRSVARLLEAVSQGWNDKGPRSGLQVIYRNEIAVRKAIDESLAFYQPLAADVGADATPEFQLAAIRKSTALVAAQIVAMSEATEGLRLRQVDPEVRQVVYAIHRTLTQASLRLSSYVVSLLPEESLLLQNRLLRVRELAAVLEQQLQVKTLPEVEQAAFRRVSILAGRVTRLMEHILERLGGADPEKRVYRSYSLLKTIYVLHPGQLFRSLRLLLNTRTEHFRYALRLGIASAVAMAFSKLLPGSHNYWIPFTVILISQPYIGATLAKARDRLVGTVTGGVVGGLFLLLPNVFLLQEVLLFVASVLMVVYVRKNYAIAAFFITISLVLLLDVEQVADVEVILVRAISTMVGAAIAVLSGFMLLPVWDKKKLPEHLADALLRNRDYLAFTYSGAGRTENWTRYKRLAETANSKAFESLQRYLEEPDGKQKLFVQPYQLLTHNVRITRDLTQIHLERETVIPEAMLVPAASSGTLLNDIWPRLERVIAKYAQQVGRQPDLPVTPVTATAGSVIEIELLQKISTELQAMESTLIR